MPPALLTADGARSHGACTSASQDCGANEPWLQQDLTRSGCPIIAGKPELKHPVQYWGLKSKASCKSYEDSDENGTQIFQTFPNIQVQCCCVTSYVSWSFLLDFRTVPVDFRRCLGFLRLPGPRAELHARVPYTKQRCLGWFGISETRFKDVQSHALFGFEKGLLTAQQMQRYLVMCGQQAVHTKECATRLQPSYRGRRRKSRRALHEKSPWSLVGM